MLRKRFLAAAAAALMMSGPAARGQWVEKKSVTLDGAQRAIGAIVSEAQKRKTTGAIAVVDAGGNL